MAIFCTLSHLVPSIEVASFAKIRVSVAVHGEDFVILACVVLTQYRSETDGHTDGRTDVSTMVKTREALHAVACKNLCPKIFYRTFKNISAVLLVTLESRRRGDAFKKEVITTDYPFLVSK